jgi:CDP-paratose 2-epimerase
VLDVSDAVQAYVSAWRNIEAVRGRAFNLGGGPQNAISLKQLLLHIEALIARPVATTYSDWRAGDQRYYVSDTRLAARELGLKAATPWRNGVAALCRWLEDERGAPGRVAAPPRTAEALS